MPVSVFPFTSTQTDAPGSPVPMIVTDLSSSVVPSPPIVTAVSGSFTVAGALSVSPPPDPPPVPPPEPPVRIDAPAKPATAAPPSPSPGPKIVPAPSMETVSSSYSCGAEATARGSVSSRKTSSSFGDHFPQTSEELYCAKYSFSPEEIKSTSTISPFELRKTRGWSPASPEK